MTCQTVNKRPFPSELPHGFLRSFLNVFTTVAPFPVKWVCISKITDPQQNITKPTTICFNIDIFGWLGPSGSPRSERNETTPKRTNSHLWKSFKDQLHKIWSVKPVFKSDLYTSLLSFQKRCSKFGWTKSGCCKNLGGNLPDRTQGTPRWMNSPQARSEELEREKRVLAAKFLARKFWEKWKEYSPED